MDVVPLGVVPAQVGAARVEDDDAPAIDDGRAELDARLLDVVDLRLEALRVEVAEDGAEGVGDERAAARRLLDRRREQVRRLDQRFLGRLAVARIDLAELPLQEERDPERVGDEDADEDPCPAANGAPRSPWTARRSARALRSPG